MKFVLSGAFILGGIALAVLVWQPLTTGRNYSGWLGRSVRANENSRLQGVPSLYFRAWGLFLGAMGALFVFLGIAFAIAPPGRTEGTWNIVFAIALAIFGVVEVVSLAMLIVLSARYGLFRWSRR